MLLLLLYNKLFVEDMSMNLVAPFWGLCCANKSVKLNNLSKLICPPCDTISAEQKENSKSEHELGAVNSELSSSYDGVKQKIEELIQGNVLTFSNAPSLYIYEISYKVNDQTYRMHGIIGALKLPEPEEDYIMPPQKTLQVGLSSHFDLLETTKYQLDPVCVLYEDSERKIFDLVSEITESSCLAKSKQSGRTHKVWEVSDGSKINEIVEIFSKKNFYILDGDDLFWRPVHIKTN